MVVLCLEMYKTIFNMKFVRAFSFSLIGLVVVGTLSAAKPALAVTSEEITGVSEGLESDSGMIASAAELAWLQPGRPFKFLIYM